MKSLQAVKLTLRDANKVGSNSLTKSQSTIQQLTKELNEAKTQNSNLQSTIASHVAMLKSGKDAVQNLTTNETRLSESLTLSQTKLQQVTKELEVLQKNLQKLQADTTRLRDDNKALTTSLLAS